MGWDVSHAQMNAANVWKMESEGGRKQMNRMKYLGVTVACWSWRRAYHASRGSCWDGMVSRAKHDAMADNPVHSSEGCFFWQTATSVSCTATQAIFLGVSFDIPVGSMAWVAAMVMSEVVGLVFLG